MARPTRVLTVLALLAASVAAAASANASPEEAYRGFYYALTTATRFSHLDPYLPSRVIRERDQTLGPMLDAAANRHISRADMERAMLDAARPDTSRWRLDSVRERQGARTITPEGLERTLLDIELRDLRTGATQRSVVVMERELDGWVFIEQNQPSPTTSQPRPAP